MPDPKDVTTQPMRETPSPARNELIESIYRIALEPMAYDNFMGHWDEYISGRLDELNQLKTADETRNESATNPEIETHFQIAAQLLDQIGRPEPVEDDTKGTRNPQILMDANGRIVWSSNAASHLFALGPANTQNHLPLDEAQSKALTAMRQAIKSHSETPAPVLVNLPSQNDPGEVIYMVARVLQEQGQEDLILITAISPEWPRAMARLLREGFSLSASEIEICELIADGMNPASIAKARRSALATVRTQIKKILAKTRCGSQAEVVRLLHSVMRVADQEETSNLAQSTIPERQTLFKLSARTMPVQEFGDPKGYPVIFFHGMLDGIPIRPAFEKKLRYNNLRLICPIRPYFGVAEPAEGTPLSANQRFAQDVTLMIETMQINRPILWGYMGGAMYAHGLAATLPQGSIKGILGTASAVPILSSKQFRNMSRRQRLVAFTARYTPRILPFVVRAGISQMDQGGADTFVQSLYESAPHDRKIALDPEVRDFILEGLRFTVQQGHKAFEIDSHNIVTDWSALVEGSDTPIRLLHGEHDPACDVSALRDFAVKYASRTSLEVLSDTGQLILYKYPEKVIAELCNIRDKGVRLR